MSGFSRPLAVLVAGAYFMENLDATIIAPVPPAIVESVGVQPVSTNVAMTAYLLCSVRPHRCWTCEPSGSGVCVRPWPAGPSSGW